MKRWGNMVSVLALILMASVWMGSSCAVNRGPSAEELAAIEAERQRAIADSLRAERAEEEARLAAEKEARLAEAKRAAAQEEARRIAEEETRRADALHKEMMSLATVYFDYDKSNVRADQRSARRFPAGTSKYHCFYKVLTMTAGHGRTLIKRDDSGRPSK